MEPQHQGAKPFVGFDDNDQSAVLATIAITSLMITASVIVAKLLYWRSLHILRDYDYILLGGVLFLSAQSMLVVHVAVLGIGKHTAVLEDSMLNDITKVQYAINLLEVISIYCTKFCMCLFIRSINTYSSIHFANKILMGALSILSLVTFFANAFRCSLPSPWVAESAAICSAAIPITVFTVISIMITDVMIFLLALSMVIRVQTTPKVKILVIALFSARLLVVGTLVPVLEDSSFVLSGRDTDFTWHALRPMVWLLVSSHLAVITACTPSLKGLFDSWLGNTFGVEIDAPYQLEPVQGKGGFAVSARQGENESSSSGCGRSKLCGSKGAKISNASQSAGRPSRTSTLFASSAAALKLTASSPTQASCSSTRHTAGEQRNSWCNSKHIKQQKDDGQSESVKGLTDGVIMIHNDVEVRHENRDRGSCSSRDSRN